uniref:Regulation of nuclear pre-mRNA domain-containing protein 2 n=1 Tax=Culex tarsalis TaxID=7177 RepID=A0A1Q3EWY2_CULTA
MSKTATLSVTASAGAGAAAAREFDVPGFEQRLRDLKDTQDSIQQLSAWCLQRRVHHKKIVNSWLNVLKQVKVESRLTLFYLANDVIQYSKRKNYEYVDSWGTYLQKATTMVRDEKVKHKILRIFKIWEQREIYNDEFLADLNGLLSATTSSSTAKKNQESASANAPSGGATLATGPTRLAETKQAVAAAAAVTVVDIEDFQTASLVSTIKECVKNENDTDTTFKSLNKTPFVDVEAVKSSIKGKDRKSVEDIEREIEENLVHYQSYVHSLKTELKSRRMLISLLEQAETFYHSQRGEVKVVANAYRNFGNRLKSMKKKLDELTTTLPSPIPSPDINAPSPEPDMDLQLPDDQSYFNMNGMMNSSYMDGNLPFDISDFRRESPSSTVQSIQVINSRKEESEGVNDFLKSFFPDTPGRNYPLSGGRPPAQQQQQQQQNPPLPSRPSVGGFGPSSNSSMDDYGGGGGGGGPADYTAGLNSYGVPSNVVGGGNDYGLPGLGPRPNNHHPGAGMGMSRNYGGGGGGPQYNQPMLSDYSGGRGPQPGNRGPLLPPPPPPVNLDRSDEYNSTWDMSMTWDGPHDSSAFQGLDTPVSPPHYERKGDRNTNVIEYIDGVNEDGPLQDVDHRQLPTLAQLPPAFMKEKGRLMDVDHRNLISLTGSPGPLLSNKSGLDDLENVDDDDEDDILLTGNRHKGGALDSKPSANQPTPVPAPVSPVVNTSTSSTYWANTGDIDLRFGAPPTAAVPAAAAASTTAPKTATTTAPSTLCSNSNSSIATNATSESKDLDMRIQSMQKTLDSHFGEVSSIGGDSKSGDEVPSGLQSLLQTPASLLEIDDFLQNFERENNFDMSKPPSRLMSNQEGDLSPSPSPPSLTASLPSVAASTPRRGLPAVQQQQQLPTGHDDASSEPKKPVDNNESVDMDLSEPEESLELDQMAAAVANQNSSSELQEGGGDIYEDSAEPYEPFEGEDPDEPVPEFPDEAEMGLQQQEQQNQQQRPPPLMAEPIQRPPLLPDPAGFPPHFAFQAQQQQQQQQRNQWDLPPPLPPQMNNFGGTAGIPSLTDLANFGEFPNLAAGLSNMGSPQPPPGMPPHVWNNQFNSPNRGPPPGGFGGSPFGGGGGGGGGRGNFRNNQWQGGGPRDGGAGGGPRHGSPYFRGGGGRGNFRGGKFRGGGGGGHHNNNNNRGGNWLDSFIRNGGDVLQLITQFGPTLEQLSKK